MSWLRRRVEGAVDRKASRHEVTGEARQQFLTLATGFLGRATGDDAGAFDEAVRAAHASASRGDEARGLTELAEAIRSAGVPITIEELSAFGRAARAFGIHEDQWTFLGACVQK